LGFFLHALSAFASRWALLKAFLFAQPVTPTGALWRISRPFWALNTIGIFS
jgi:hypothetical protein